MGVFARRYGGSGGGSPFATSSGGGPTQAQLALNQVGLTEQELGKYREPEENRTPGILGAVMDTVKNIPGDVAEMAEGLLDLGSMVGRDVLSVLPGGEKPSFEATGNLVKNLPSALHQYGKEQYGIDPLKADLIPEKLPTAIREDPLNTALDIIGAGSVAGKAANAVVKPATLRALRAGTAPADLPAVSKRLLPGVNPESPYFDLPNIGQGTDRRLGRQPLTPDQVDRVRLGGYRPQLELSTAKLAEPAWSRAYALHENFFRRGMSNVFHRALTQDIGVLPEQVAAAADRIKEGLRAEDLASEMRLRLSEAHRLHSRARMYNAAREFGVQRIHSDFLAKRIENKTAQRFIGMLRSDTTAARNEEMAGIAGAFSDLTKTLRKQGMKGPEAAAWVDRLTDYFEGLTPLAVKVQKMGLDDTVRHLHDPQVIAAAEAAGTMGELTRLQQGWKRLHEYKRDLALDLVDAETARRAATRSGASLDERLALHKDVVDLQTEMEATERYAAHLSEWLDWRRREPANPDEAVAKTMARVRWERHNLVMDSVLEETPRGAGLTFRSQMATAYGPAFLSPSGRRGPVKVGLNKDGTVRYANRERHGGLSEEELRRAFHNDAASLRALFEDDKVFWSKMDDTYSNRPAPVYYPQYNPEKVKRSDFIGMSTKLQGAARQNLGPFQARTYYNFLNGQYQRDAFQAYAWAAARTRSILGTQKFLDAYAKRFGRVIQHADEAAEFEAIYNPWLLKQHYMNQAQVHRYLVDALDEGMELQDAVKVAIRRAEDAIDAVDDVDPSLGGKEMYAIPRHIADQLEAYSNYRLGNTGLTLFMGRSTDLWRSLVLAYSPRWLVNNLLGNIFFAKLMGVPLTRVLAQALSSSARKNTTFAKALRAAGVTGKRAAKLEEILTKADPALVRSINASFHTPAQMHVQQLGRHQSSALGQMVEYIEDKGRKVAARKEQLGKYNPLRINVKKTITNWNTHVEDAFRQTAFIHEYERLAAINRTKKVGDSWWRSVAQMERIAKEGLDEVTAREAVRRVNFFFNDYRQLTPLERNIIRPYVAPFWGFWKHVNLLTFKFPFESPERALAIRGLAEFARQENLEDATAITDEYRLHGLVENPTGLGNDILSFKAAIPVSAAAEFLRDPSQALGGLLGPVPGTAQEFISGRDFLGRPFEQEGTYRPFGTEQAYTFTRDAQGNITGVDDIDVRQNLGQILWNQVPQLGILGALGTGETRYGTETKRSAEIARLFGFSTLNPVSEDAQEYQRGILMRALSGLTGG